MENKEITEALLKAGFEEKSPGRISFEGYELRVKDYDTLESVFKKLINMGKTLKVWEFKKTMQIIDPMF